MIYSYEKEGYTIEGGTLEQLVEQLYCGTCPDADYIQTFLLGYKLFMQSEELMDMLLQKVLCSYLILFLICFGKLVLVS